MGLVFGSAQAVAETPTAGSSSLATNAEDTVLQPGDAAAVDPASLAVFRASASMSGARADVCPVVNIDSWRVPLDDPTPSTPSTPTVSTGSSSGADKPIPGPSLSADALGSAPVAHRGFTVCDRAGGDELPASPTYELSSTPG